jgi:hypothetical protein
MAFGVDYTGFLDSFDTGKVVGTGAQAKARERANSFLDAAKVGGAGVDIFGKMRYKEITDECRSNMQIKKVSRLIFSAKWQVLQVVSDLLVLQVGLETLVEEQIL